MMDDYINVRELFQGKFGFIIAWFPQVFEKNSNI